MELERRWTSPGLARLEVRQEDGAEPTLSGYAAVFNSDYETKYWTERIDPGAFAETLANGDYDVPLLREHEWGMPMARASAGSLTLEEDDAGLRFEAQPVMSVSYAADTVALVRGGIINGMSFGFFPDVEETDTSGDKPIFTVKRATLFEISAVTFPAYAGTTISARHRQVRDARAKSVRDAQALRTRMLDEYGKRLDKLR